MSSFLHCPRCNLPLNDGKSTHNTRNVHILRAQGHRDDPEHAAQAIATLKRDLHLVAERRAQLTAAGEQLDREEAVIQHEIEQYQASAVQFVFRRLPIEVLGLIFVFYLDGQPEDLPPPSPYSWRPYILSLVCSRWRNAVFNIFGELWTNIRVNLWAPESVWKPHMIRHLEHSRHHGLHISFVAPTSFESPSIHPKSLALLRAHADRIQSLHFQIPTTLFNLHAVLSGLQSSFSSLSAITLPYAERPRDDILVRAPALQNVVLDQISSLTMLWQLPWSQLTSLTLNRCEVDPMIHALSQSPNLTSLSLGLFPQLMFEGDPIRDHPIIHLKQLHHLHIKSSNLGYHSGSGSANRRRTRPLQRTMQMLSSIHCPNLRSIALDLPSETLVRTLALTIESSNASISSLSITDLWIQDKAHILGVSSLFKTVSGSLQKLSLDRNPTSEQRKTHQISLVRKADSYWLQLLADPASFQRLTNLVYSHLDFNQLCAENVLALIQSSSARSGGGSLDIGFTPYSHKVPIRKSSWDAFLTKLRMCLEGCAHSNNTLQTRVTLNI